MRVEERPRPGEPSGLTGAPAGTAGSARDASVGSAIRLAAEIVIRVSSIVATLWLARSMGVSTFGSFVLVLSIGLVIAELSDLGINAIVVPLVVRSRRNLRTLLLMKAAMSGLVVLLSTALVPLASWLSETTPLVLALCTLHFLGASFVEMTGTALRALGHSVDEAILLLLARLALLGLVIAGPFGLSLQGASMSYALSIVPAVVLAFIFLGARRGSNEGGVGLPIPEVIRYALPLGVNGYLAILSSRVELFLLQAFGGPYQVGLFGGAVRIVTSLLTLPAAISAGALPPLTRDIVNGWRGAAQRTFGLVVWIGVPAAVGLFLCAEDVLRILGPGFVEGALALRVLSLALLLSFLNTALSHVLIAAGESTLIARLTAMRVLSALVLAVALIPPFGLAGASWSYTMSEGLLFAASLRASRLHTPIDVARPLGFALLACVPMVVFLWIWPGSLMANLAVSAFLFGVASAVILRRGTERSGLA